MSSQPKRRHETTVGDVTAWAGPWEPDEHGESQCSILSEGRWCGDVRVYPEDGDMTMAEDLSWRPAEALVMSRVLQEAALLAQGKPLPCPDCNGKGFIPLGYDDGDQYRACGCGGGA